MKNLFIEFKWAFVFIVISLAWVLLEKLSGLHSTYIEKHAVFTNFFAIPAIAIYVFALLEKRYTFYGGTMTYQQGFICGAVITLIVSLFSPLTQIITTKLITPDFFPNAIKYSVSSGLMKQAEATSYFSLEGYIKVGLIGALAMGILTTAIVAIFTRGVKK